MHIYGVKCETVFSDKHFTAFTALEVLDIGVIVEDVFVELRTHEELLVAIGGIAFERLETKM